MEDKTYPDNSPAGEEVHEHLRPLSDLEREATEDFRAFEDGTVRLRACSSKTSGALAFPAASICPETGLRDMEAFETESEAVLYSYSTIHVSASRPVPYTVGYVDFACGLRVLAQVRWPRGPVEGCDVPVRLVADAAQWWVEPTADAEEVSS